MQIEFDEKTNEVTIKMSINPASTQPSSSGKTFICGTDSGKLDVGSKTIRVNVNAFTAATKSKSKK